MLSLMGASAHQEKDFCRSLQIIKIRHHFDAFYLTTVIAITTPSTTQAYHYRLSEKAFLKSIERA